MRRWIQIIALSLAVALLAAAAPAALRKGDSGEAVAALQQRLILLGYLHARADGAYGLKTQQAVSRFQRQHGLTHDGVAGSETLDLLGAADERVQATVYVAPSGKRYHVRQNCRGLRNAQRVDAIGFLDAKQIRTPCILCYGRTALHLALEARAAEQEQTSVGKEVTPAA